MRIRLALDQADHRESGLRGGQSVSAGTARRAAAELSSAVALRSSEATATPLTVGRVPYDDGGGAFSPLAVVAVLAFVLTR